MQYAMEISENEEEKTMMEEKYSSLADEVEAKTKKLKKLWTKYQSAKSEAKDLQQEFQVGYCVFILYTFSFANDMNVYILQYYILKSEG